MVWNNHFWAEYITDVFIPDVDTFAQCLTKRLLPTFNTLDTEAEQLKQEEYDRLANSIFSDDGDLSEIAEKAHDKAISFYITMSNALQGIINMFTVGLYHLWEQQLILLHRKELVKIEDEKNISLRITKKSKARLKSEGVPDDVLQKLNGIKSGKNKLEFLDNVNKKIGDEQTVKYISSIIKHAEKHFSSLNSNEAIKALQENGIDVTKFNCWTKIDELRLVANTVKHADGESAEELKELRPDMFKHPDSMLSIQMSAKLVGPVYLPLFGEGLYITQDEFDSYVITVKEFWNDLSTDLEMQKD